MQTSLSAVAVVCAAGMMLVGTSSAQTQHTSPAKHPTSSATSANKTPVRKKATATTTKKAASSALSTRKDKFSYSLGVNIGTRLSSDLKRQSIEYDPKLLEEGLRDALSGNKTRLTEQEMQAVMRETQAEVIKEMQEKAAKVAAANKAEGEAFLVANKAKEGVVTLPSGLQYKILKEGTGPKPTASDTVVCNYKGTLLNGTEFDSSYKRGKPATFPVSGVIKGWTEALQLMPVGSKWQLFIPANLAYGDRGAGSEIGPDSTLVFEVELESIQAKEELKDKPKDETQPKDEGSENKQ
jgi:FKBP-type peptidyl-prolyl cis-trans isomerase FklB